MECITYRELTLSINTPYLPILKINTNKNNLYPYCWTIIVII